MELRGADRFDVSNRTANRTDGKPGGILFSIVIAVAALYFARLVFIPVALAVLLAFLLAPLVVRLRHWHFGRVPSVLIVVLFSFFIIATFGAMMVSQLADLGHELPQYQENVRVKLRTIGSSGGGLITRVSRAVHNFTQDLSPPPARPNGEDKPVPVEIRKAPFAPLDIIRKVLGSVLDIALMSVIVIVFVIFILLEREDLRDRLIRLVGAGQVRITTEALNDAGRRLSRYLLAQLIVNASFGVLAGVGLYFIGVHHPVLWGLLAMLLRYIPYLGIWVAAAMPALLTFAVEPGWVRVPLIFSLYGGIDLIFYNFVEPNLYGNTTGLTPIAILLATVFWTWLWGPVGLLLATPLTVCLVVVGRYVPSLEFVRILLTDEPVLQPHVSFYQRLLGGNPDEAIEFAEDYLKNKSLEELGDDVIIPALSLWETDRHRGALDPEKREVTYRNLRMLVEDISDRAGELTGNRGDRPSENRHGMPPPMEPIQKEAAVVCVPARDEADEIAALLLERILNHRGVKAFSCASLPGDCLAELKHRSASLACVVVVPPYGRLNSRYICRRVRTTYPNMKLMAAILTEGKVDEFAGRVPSSVADETVASLKQAVPAILSILSAGKSAEAA